MKKIKFVFKVIVILCFMVGLFRLIPFTIEYKDYINFNSIESAEKIEYNFKQVYGKYIAGYVPEYKVEGDNKLIIFNMKDSKFVISNHIDNPYFFIFTYVDENNKEYNINFDSYKSYKEFVDYAYDLFDNHNWEEIVNE